MRAVRTHSSYQTNVLPLIKKVQLLLLLIARRGGNGHSYFAYFSLKRYVVGTQFEESHRDASNEYPQQTFSLRNKEIIADFL